MVPYNTRYFSKKNELHSDSTYTLKIFGIFHLRNISKQVESQIVWKNLEKTFFKRLFMILWNRFTKLVSIFLRLIFSVVFSDVLFVFGVSRNPVSLLSPLLQFGTTSAFYLELFCIAMIFLVVMVVAVRFFLISWTFLVSSYHGIMVTMASSLQDLN